MIKAGTHTIEDGGFAVVTESVGGVPRQTIVLELSGGIDGDTLAALCAGPIEVLNEAGEVIQTHTGPFRISTHSLKLTRNSASGDVAALTAQVNALEAELVAEASAKESALTQLAIVTEQLSELRAAVDAAKASEAVSVAAVDAGGQ